MFVSLSTGVETENGSCGTEILQEGPTAAGCGHEIGWIGVTAEEFTGCMMLEDEIHLEGNLTNALEDQRVL